MTDSKITMDKSQKKDINTVTKSLLILLFSFVIFTMSGISYSFAEHVEHISVREQLKQDISFQELQCYNSNHVLTIRDNGKAACVTEVMAQKLDWIVIQRHFAIHSTPEEVRSVYGGRAEIPRDEDGNYVFEAPTVTYNKFFKTDITLSQIPQLGETAEIKVKIGSLSEYHDGIISPLDYIRLHLPEGFELIEGELEQYGPFIGDSLIIEATIKAVKPGSWLVYTPTPGGSYATVYIFITEHGSFFHNGHHPFKIDNKPF